MDEHITIGDIAPRVQYVADGVQASFTYPFPIFAAGDLEVRLDGLPAPTGFTVQGAGQSTGGVVVFDAPPAPGQQVTLRRNLAIARTSDFQENGILRARILNDELDYQVAALQELKDGLGNALRLDPSETGGTLLPLRAARANRVLAFDSVGNATTIDPGAATLHAPYAGAVARTVEDKLAEHLSARDFGAVGDGRTDDGPALQAAMTAAVASGKYLEIGEGTFRTTMPLTLGGGAAGLMMRGTILYAGPGGSTALTLGDGGAIRNGSKRYEGMRVVRSIQSDWLDENDIGLCIRNCDVSFIEVRQVEGFTIGLRTLGDGRGFEDTSLFLGRIVNNRIGLDIRTGSAAGWNTSVRYYGGHFAIGQSVNTDKDRFGVRFSAPPGAYIAHNRHIFHGQAFELQARNKPITGIPFLSEVSSRAVIAQAIRMEGCSPFVARHTSAAQDHVYEVAWASQAYGIDIDYAGATRVGSVVRALHQAAGHREATRQIAAIPNLRIAAFRWSATETAFDGLACLSTNVSGTPSRLPDFTFAALDSYTLTNRGVMLPGGRGLGFVVDSSDCREFALAVDADAPRLIVQCFDASMNLLTAANGALVLASGMSMQWVDTPRWWQGAADMTDADLTRLQTIRLAPQVAYAIIGVARIEHDFEVRALRLCCDPSQSPPVLYGLPDLPFGVRELKTEAPWDPGSIAAGGSAQITLPLPGARAGDFASAAFTRVTSGAVFLAQVGATDAVTVTCWNRSGAALALGPNTVRARVVKS